MCGFCVASLSLSFINQHQVTSDQLSVAWSRIGDTHWISLLHQTDEQAQSFLFCFCFFD